ncbi:MAG: beta-galactosidase trimerization domain-containing protein [Firmicutes bacterium]|nr:beta-galactosidase trimerization domain-containing protein [Bacillota bacterium]
MPLDTKDIIFDNGLRLSPDLWHDGNFPTMDDYRKILRRGTMLYSLDINSTINEARKEPVGPSIANRPCNLLYHTAMDNYGRKGTLGFKGPARNEMLLESVRNEKEYNDSLHAVGIPVVVYQNENNFDEGAFSKDEIEAMAAELVPFAWAFNNEGRRFACLNKPGWRDFLVERLIIRVGKTGADGVFLDNNTPFIHCRCKYCQDAYKEKFGSELIDDMGIQETVIGDMRVFDYIGYNQVPKDLVRVDNKRFMRYLEWRIEKAVEFCREIRSRLEKEIGRKIIFTSNGHVGIPEQSAVALSGVFDMVFSEEGYTAPPVSNVFSLRLGTAIGEGERCMYIVTRTVESAPVAGMVQVLSAEGRAMGGQAEFWDFHIREDEKLQEAQAIMRNFYVKHARDIYAVEKDANDIAILYSWRSDLWSSQAISPSKMSAALLEDMNLPYDILIVEKEEHSTRLEKYKLIIVPNIEIMPRVWFDAIQEYLNSGGKIISSGICCKFDENFEPYNKKWGGNGWKHFNDNVEKDYFVKRKPIGIHSGYRKPDCEYALAVEKALVNPSVYMEKNMPLISLNHTILEDGEAVHIVNRYVNVFPFIHPVTRRGILVNIKPKKKVSDIIWMSPGKEDIKLLAEDNGDYLRIEIPELDVYGIMYLAPPELCRSMSNAAI